MTGGPVKPSAFREVLAGAIAEAVKAYDLADVCVELGLAPQKDGEDPFRSKRLYVLPRLRGMTMEELRALARRFLDEYNDDHLEQQLAALDQGSGVSGELKNLIFAADGPKPRIILRDALNNDVQIVEHAEHCLVYDQPLLEGGLTWRQLVKWWSTKNPTEGGERAIALDLFARLERSLANEAEQLIFRTYGGLYRSAGFDIPALIPQVYLHYDPYTQQQLKPDQSRINRQRMDFLLLLPRRARVVIELDGRQHYADNAGRADPKRYAEMVAEDRSLRLAGYEIYRFGGDEMVDRDSAVKKLKAFFQELLLLHGIALTPPTTADRRLLAPS